MTPLEARGVEIERQRDVIHAELMKCGFRPEVAALVAGRAVYALDCAGFDIIKRERQGE